MNLPLNGRISIIDDQLNHAYPLMKILSSKQLPFSYFSGEVEFLPEEGENLNDIRLLFLDINLIDDGEHENKVLKGKLLSVLSRVISKDNYPYVIIYWSRHEQHKELIENEIFNNELKDRRPIAFLSAIKSDFFNYDGSVTDDFDEKINELFNKINELIVTCPAYNYLLQWENKVHISTDKTLQDIFSSYHLFKDWANNANYILDKLGNAYLGKYFKESTPEDKIKASFNSFNSVFKDTLEYEIFNTSVLDADILEYDVKLVEGKVNSINEKLNLSKIDLENYKKPGTIIELIDESHSKCYGGLLNNIIARHLLKESYLLKIKNDEPENVDLKDINKKAEALTNTEFKAIKSKIKESWVKIAIVVTPVCDYAQKNNVVDRMIMGLMIPAGFKDNLDKKSEAIYILPIPISFKDEEYILILDFRYFITKDLSDQDAKSVFRVRQELLSEIQSKLSRHINRQGILVLD